MLYNITRTSTVWSLVRFTEHLDMVIAVDGPDWDIKPQTKREISVLIPRASSKNSDEPVHMCSLV